MAVGVSALKPAAHRKWISVDWKLEVFFLIHLAASFLFKYVILPAPGKLRQDISKI